MAYSTKIPKTPKNIRSLNQLSLVGNNSNLPYEKLKCDLIDAESGEYLIYRGWAVINSSDNDSYNIAIYDGNIDFFKAIENKKMSSLDLSEITHIRTIDTIKDSILNELPYKYIIADFNGAVILDTIGNNYNINADYLIPSVKVSWLWNKIFETYGFQYEGTIFNSIDFQDLWLTYPKGTTIGSEITTLFSVSESNVNYNPNNIPNNELLPVNITNFVLNSGSTSLEDGYVSYVFEGTERSKIILETTTAFIGGEYTGDRDDPVSIYPITPTFLNKNPLTFSAS